MIKKIGFFLFALSLIQVSLADNSSSTSKNGFYIGGGLGGLNMSNTWANDAGTTVYFDNTHDYSINFNNNLTVDAGNIGWNMLGVVGYQWYFPKQKFLAFELFENKLNTAASTSETPSTTVTIDNQDYTFSRNFSVSMTMENVWGARFLPGYQLSESTIIYGIVGWAQARVNTKASYDLLYHDVGSNVVYPGSDATNSYNFQGYQLGAGTMIHLTDHLALRADMIYTAYNNKTLYQAVDVDPDGSTNTLNVTSELTTLEADLSLVYMFG